MFKNKPQNKPAGKKEATKQANKPQAIFTSHRPRKQATFGFKQATLATLLLLQPIVFRCLDSKKNSNLEQ